MADDLDKEVVRQLEQARRESENQMQGGRPPLGRSPLLDTVGINSLANLISTKVETVLENLPKSEQVVVYLATASLTITLITALLIIWRSGAVHTVLRGARRLWARRCRRTPSPDRDDEGLYQVHTRMVGLKRQQGDHQEGGKRQRGAEQEAGTTQVASAAGPARHPPSYEASAPEVYQHGSDESW